MSYQVFIERCLDASPAGIARASAGIAKRFGVPVAAIQQRLSGGRFRVKSNIDLAKARRFVSDLSALGVEATVVDASGAVVPAEKSPAGAQTSALPPAAKKPAPVADKSGNLYESGLSAAFSGGSAQDLGALGGEELTDGGGIKLATIDGGEGGDAAEKPSAVAAPTGPVAEEAFLPPEMLEDDDLSLLTPVPELMPDAVDEGVADSPSATAGGGDPEASSSVGLPAARAPAQVPAARPAARSRSGADFMATLARNTRVRFAVGVLFGLILGGLPAYLVGTTRHDSAIAEINKELRDDYARADTPDRWDLLEEARTGAAELIASKQRSIAIGSIALWLIVGAAATFMWERKLPWSRWDRSEAGQDPLAPS